MDLNQDWKKAMQEAGCSCMQYVKKVQKETVHESRYASTRGVFDIYEAIVLYIEKKYTIRRTVCINRSKAVIDIEQVKRCEDPVVFLCEELKTYIEAMDVEAKNKEANVE